MFKNIIFAFNLLFNFANAVRPEFFSRSIQVRLNPCLVSAAVFSSFRYCASNQKPGFFEKDGKAFYNNGRKITQLPQEMVLSSLPEGLTLNTVSVADHSDIRPVPKRDLFMQKGLKYIYDDDNYNIYREGPVRYPFFDKSDLEKTQEEAFLEIEGKLKEFHKCSEEAPEIAKALGRIESTFDINGKEEVCYGSGLLIEPDVVLTAAHNIKCKIKGEFREVDQVEFFLGYDELKNRKLSEVLYWRMPKEWMNSRRKDYDYALLFLKEKLDAPKIVLTTYNFSEHGRHLQVPGYPSSIIKKDFEEKENNPVSSYINRGELISFSEDQKTIIHNASTFYGMSGGPILLADLPIAIGVHAYGGKNNKANLGIHYSDHMQHDIAIWMKEREMRDTFWGKCSLIYKETSNLAKENIEFIKKIYKIIKK
jgi:V8-like Glu-specific endopeptidase